MSVGRYQWQEAGRHREKKLNLYHQSGALQGKAQPHMGLKGQKDLPRAWLGVGSGHITQEVTVPSLCTCHWSAGTFQLQGEPLLSSLSPSAARFHTPPMAGRTMAPKDVHALIPGSCEKMGLN